MKVTHRFKRLDLIEKVPKEQWIKVSNTVQKSGTKTDLSFLNVEFFKPAFSLSSFTFIKRLFSSSLLSAIRVVSSVYMKLLIFLRAILIPDCASSSPALHMIYSAYKLNKQVDNIQP